MLSENLETVWKVGDCLALLAEGLQVRISPHPASTRLFQLEPRRQHLTVLCISLMVMLTVCEFVGPFITSPGEMPAQTLYSVGIWMSYCVWRGFYIYIYSRYNFFIKWLVPVSLLWDVIFIMYSFLSLTPFLFYNLLIVYLASYQELPWPDLISWRFTCVFFLSSFFVVLPLTFIIST